MRIGPSTKAQKWAAATRHNQKRAHALKKKCDDLEAKLAIATKALEKVCSFENDDNSIPPHAWAWVLEAREALRELK